MNRIIESLRKNKKGILIMGIASFFTAFGQLMWKLFQLDNNGYLLIFGFLLYGLGAICMIIAFRFGSYSVIHPVMCTSYLFAIFFGLVFLKEKLNCLQGIGIILMVLGVILIGGGDE